jgi:hypothetical protein
VASTTWSWYQHGNVLTVAAIVILVLRDQVTFFHLTVFFWPPLTVLFWIPTIGTAAMVFFGYCLLARILSLMLWNRREASTLGLLKRTFLSASIAGNVMQGLPPTR